jgi:TRAP-type mannitol/chloroaromatic compound transport system permease small subunit
MMQSETMLSMPKAIRVYVHYVDLINKYVGLFAMYLIFAMLGILLFSSVSKSFFTPSLWTLEVAQFTMVAYYLLGGGHSLQLGSHVRMDLLYGNWKPRTQAWVDTFTVLFLIFFLAILLYGGISSTIYAIKYGETSRSIWAPHMAPIKVIMDIGIFLTLLQSIAILFKNIAKATNRSFS